MGRFESETGPDGAPWLPSRRAQEEGGQTLSDTGRLADSIAWRVSDDTLEVGTPVIYAAIHQKGGTIKAKTDKGLVFRAGDGFARVASVDIPARPYLGLSAWDEREIERFVEVWLDGLAKDRGGMGR